MNERTRNIKEKLHAGITKHASWKYKASARHVSLKTELPVVGYTKEYMGGGARAVLTSKWNRPTYMCLSFGTLFRKIWYSDGGGGVQFNQTRRSPSNINWVYSGQIIVETTQFGQNLMLFFRKWYTDGKEIRQKISIEKVRLSGSGRHIHVRYWWN